MMIETMNEGKDKFIKQNEILNKILDEKLWNALPLVVQIKLINSLPKEKKIKVINILKKMAQ